MRRCATEQVYSSQRLALPFWFCSIANGMKLMMALTVFALFGMGGAKAEPLKEGDTAPDFSLKGSDGKTYKLSDYKGKKVVVLAWYPKAFTPGCTAECKSMAANSADLKKYD